MQFMLNAGEDYIYNPLLLNNNLRPPDLSAQPFGFHSAGNSQLLDTSARFQQNPASNDSSHGETQRFMISSNGVQNFRLRQVSAPMSTNSKFAEATPVRTTEPRPPQSGGLSNYASLPVNSGATAKAGKKRSRASRRAPTTLLNTSTSNFRAMVQRFTGIPETPFGYSSVNPNFSVHVTQQGWQLLGRQPSPYKGELDLNMNCVSQHPSAPHLLSSTL